MANSNSESERNVEFAAQNIVYQLGDFYELPVDLRQKTNDEAIDFVKKIIEAELAKARIKVVEELLEYRPYYVGKDGHVQASKLYTGWFDDKGKPFVEANGVLLPIIPYFTDYEADLAITILVFS